MEREREREREWYVCVWIYPVSSVLLDREKEGKSEPRNSSLLWTFSCERCSLYTLTFRKWESIQNAFPLYLNSGKTQANTVTPNWSTINEIWEFFKSTSKQLLFDNDKRLLNKSAVFKTRFLRVNNDNYNDKIDRAATTTNTTTTTTIPTTTITTTTTTTTTIRPVEILCFYCNFVGVN